MVTIHFRLRELDAVELTLTTPQPLADILAQCSAKVGIELGGVITVRDGQVLTAQSLVEDGDELEVFPAISGG